MSSLSAAGPLGDLSSTAAAPRVALPPSAKCQRLAAPALGHLNARQATHRLCRGTRLLILQHLSWAGEVGGFSIKSIGGTFWQRRQPPSPGSSDVTDLISPPTFSLLSLSLLVGHGEEKQPNLEAPPLCWRHLHLQTLILNWAVFASFSGAWWTWVKSSIIVDREWERGALFCSNLPDGRGGEVVKGSMSISSTPMVRLI